MTTMNIALSELHADPVNARQISTDDLDDMIASLRERGQLQPILVRRNEDGPYTVVAGARRVAAARALDWTEIRADTIEADDTEALAISTAENMVRKDMHPVDTWRAMTRLIDAGVSLRNAADSLGITERFARRLETMGRLAPAMIEALAGEPQLPREHTLSTVALAPPEVQEKALHSARRRDGIDWDRVAQACDRRRLSRSVAIFDVESAGVIFDEDLFAEPGSDEQFTTTDVRGFIREQTKALGERISASKGRMIGVKCDQWGSLTPPAGWTLSFDPVPKRWKKNDPRKHAVAVLTEGYNTGSIVERVMVPKAKPVPQPDLVGGAEAAPSERRARDPITKTVQSQIAGIKTEALREAVAAFTSHGPADMLRLLLLALTADNISVQTSSQKYGDHGLDFLVNGLLDKNGGLTFDYGPDELCAMVADVIGHCIAFDHPNSTFGTSGDTAEWLGQITGAIDFVPRMDTAEILKGFTYDALVDIARAQGISEDGTTKQIRERMIGNMPGWRPMTFGAPVPAPTPVEDADDDTADERADYARSTGQSIEGEAVA